MSADFRTGPTISRATSRPISTLETGSEVSVHGEPVPAETKRELSRFSSLSRSPSSTLSQSHGYLFMDAAEGDSVDVPIAPHGPLDSATATKGPEFIYDNQLPLGSLSPDEDRREYDMASSKEALRGGHLQVYPDDNETGELYETIPPGYLLIVPDDEVDRSNEAPALPSRPRPSQGLSANSPHSTFLETVADERRKRQQRELETGTTFLRITLEIPGLARGGLVSSKIIDRYNSLKSESDGILSPQQQEFCDVFEDMAEGKLSDPSTSPREKTIAARILLAQAGDKVLDGVFQKDGILGKAPKEKIWEAFIHGPSQELSYVLEDAQRLGKGIALKSKEQAELKKAIHTLAHDLFISGLKESTGHTTVMNRSIQAAEFIERCADMIHKGSVIVVQNLLGKARDLGKEMRGTSQEAQTHRDLFKTAYPEFFQKSAYGSKDTRSPHEFPHYISRSQSLRTRPASLSVLGTRTTSSQRGGNTGSVRLSRHESLSVASWHGTASRTARPSVQTLFGITGAMESTHIQLSTERLQTVGGLFTDIEKDTQAKTFLYDNLNRCLDRLQGKKDLQGREAIEHIFTTILVSRPEEDPSAVKQRQRQELYEYLERFLATQADASAARRQYPQYLGDSSVPVPPARTRPGSISSYGSNELSSTENEYELPVAATATRDGQEKGDLEGLSDGQPIYTLATRDGQEEGDLEGLSPADLQPAPAPPTEEEDYPPADVVAFSSPSHHQVDGPARSEELASQGERELDLSKPEDRKEKLLRMIKKGGMKITREPEEDPESAQINMGDLRAHMNLLFGTQDPLQE